jgi:hypothetical protein
LYLGIAAVRGLYISSFSVTTLTSFLKAHDITIISHISEIYNERELCDTILS